VISGTLFDVTSVDSSGLRASVARGFRGRQDRAGAARHLHAADKLVMLAGGALAVIVYNNPGGNTFSRSNGASVGTSTLPAMFVNQSEGAGLKARVAQDSGVQVALDFRGVTEFGARTDVSVFSSRGPSVGSALKPDLAAVGEEIVTGAQNSYTSGESYSVSGFIDTAGTSFSTPLAAGAAAVLKGARPGLTVAQYRSLLINGAATATAGEGVAATMSQAGAGILNLAAAVGGTVAANPTALSFGAGATLHSTVQFSLSNVGPAADTYTIQAVPTGNDPAPSIGAGTVSLDPGAMRQVPVTLDASGLTPGEYSGYLLVSGTASAARIPYWFAVPGSEPAGISILYQDFFDSPRSSSSQAVVFRVTEAAGLPYGSLRPQYASGRVRCGGCTAWAIFPAYAVDITPARRAWS
jgi:hypothetical protein